MRRMVKKHTLLCALVVSILLVVSMGLEAQTIEPDENIWDLNNYTVIDLSHQFDSSNPCDPALTPATLHWFAKEGSGPGALWNLENITYTPHTGTHIDAPYHVNSVWGAIETVDPTILIGPAVVLDVPISDPNYVITVSDIMAAEIKGSPILPGDGVLVMTGFSKNWPNKKNYIDNGYPTFSVDAAAYIVSKRARFVGMETISPEGASTAVHKVFLGNGCTIIENLANLDKIGQNRCITVGTFPNIKGASGAWIRLLAIIKK